MHRMWTAAILTIAMLAPTAACTGNEGEPDPEKYLSGVVTIGVQDQLPGLSWRRDGVWTGFDIDLAHWLAREGKFEVEFTPVTTAERMDKLINAGHTAASKTAVKLVIANFSMTTARREHIDFVGPYFADKQGFLTLAGSDVKTLKDLAGKNVCVTQASTTELRLPGMTATATSERTLQACLERLRRRHVAAISSDLVILQGFAAWDNDISPNLPADLRLRVLPETHGGELYGIGIPNNRPRLCEYLLGMLSKYLEQRWTQAFKDNFPNVSPDNRRPDPGSLTPCEQPK